MKIVRHVAPDMRQAMRAIREQLGEDAVILSSKRTPTGVEITAAIDFDATTLEAEPLPSVSRHPPAAPAFNAPGMGAAPPVFNAALRGPNTAHLDTSHAAARAAVHTHARPQSHTQAPASNARVSRGTPARTEPTFDAPRPTPDATRARASNPVASDEREFTSHLRAAQSESPWADAEPPVPVRPQARVQAHTQVATSNARVSRAAPARTDVPTFDAGTEPPAPARAAAALPAPAAQAPALSDAMGHELKTLRRMLETQLAQLAWNDMARRAPIHTELLRELTEIGISQDLSEYILKQLPEKADLAYARRFAITGLSQYLLTTGDRWLEDGGRVAFIGSTGVGKTTMLAKLAVRWVLRQGPREIALVASDTVRIGAQDQMQALGQLLGVPVYVPERFESLPGLVSRLDRYRLVLIDTPGSSLRDAQLFNRLAVLANSSSQFETALVLAASTQAGALEETVKRFAPASPACCLLTKVDEAASLGGALSVLIRARLPISYMSEGQRVPEDLKPARALELVSHAVRLAKATGAAADEELLRRRFGKISNALT